MNEIHVINDVTLDLPDTGMVAIFGPSGCGKTTLLNVIGGLDSQNSGTVTINDKAMRTDDAIVRNREIGVIFQNYSLNRDETVAENVADALRLCGMQDEKEISERVTAALAGVGMDKYSNRLPDTLSGGQQQRVAIARAIVKNPSVILADEPTGNLDETNTILVMDILKVMSRNCLVLLVTHEADLVDSYCDTVVELKDGKIVSIHENEDANGYAAKKKNEIFLGELAHRTKSDADTELDIYGETPENPVKITLVNKGGRLYIQVNTPKVTVLDDSSEVKLREGVFSESEEMERKEKEIDMSKLPPIEGKEYGKLFRFRKTLRDGFTSNYRNIMRQRSKKLLRLCLALFGAAIVFITAYCATGIRKRIEIRERYNNNVFLVYAGGTDISAEMQQALENSDSGITDFYVRSQIRTTKIGEDTMNFRMASFDTAGVYEGGFSRTSGLDFPVSFHSADSVAGRKVVAGRTDNLMDNEAVITTQTADKILRDAPYKFMKDYKNLLGMIGTYHIADTAMNVHIVGIVDADEPAVFVTSRLLDYISLYCFFGDFENVIDDYANAFDLKPGECVFVRNIPTRSASYEFDYFGDRYASPVTGYDESEIKVGEEFTINNVKVKVKEYIDLQLPNFEEILAKHGFASWSNIDSEQSSIIMDELNVAYNKVMDKRYDFIGKIAGNFMFNPDKNLYSMFESYSKIVIVHPDDYHKLSRVVGLTSRRINNSYQRVEYPMPIREVLRHSPHTYDFDTLYYQVYSSDPEKTEKYLNEHFSYVTPPEKNLLKDNASFSPKTIYTPEDRFERSTVSMGSEFVKYILVWAAVIVMMCVSMYFIMRSTVMGRMREIGIYRAIGTSKKNIVFRFAVETGVVVTMSVMLGYLIASAAVLYVQESGGVASEVIYYPLWVAALTLVLLYVICIPCGILPILRLIRKTPSEILAKYDI
ncbi:MAG: ABC transporter ATP-binding protein/permease [Lachnospiraceae bacterium]|nr:ABC transporter ATP-binding protein/permease [Lachnospiraceae bacterium]